MSKLRPLARKLDPATYSTWKSVVFRVADPGAQHSDEVRVPVPVIHRLHHIGRGYELHQLRNLEPANMTSFDYVAAQMLLLELEQALELVNDPALRAYVLPLTALIVASQSNTKSTLVMRP